MRGCEDATMRWTCCTYGSSSINFRFINFRHCNVIEVKELVCQCDETKNCEMNKKVSTIGQSENRSSRRNNSEVLTHS
jgi:hypothetical protein